MRGGRAADEETRLFEVATNGGAEASFDPVGRSSEQYQNAKMDDGDGRGRYGGGGSA